MKVEVRCPSCTKIGFIDISDNEFTNVNRGLLAINIAERIICNHTFVIYVDKNLVVRDCFIADFHIRIPVLETSKEIKEDTILEVNKIDLILLKLNLPASLLAYILRSIFLNKKIVLINNQKYLYEHIRSLFNYITVDNFQNTLEIIISNDFFKNMDKYKDYIILEGNKIVQDKDKIINLKSIQVERTIIEKFLSENDSVSSIWILKKEIQKSYNLAKTIVEFVNTFKGKEIQSKNILDYLFQKYRTKFNLPYLDFLIEIVENNFKIKIPKPSGISDFLGLL